MHYLETYDRIGTLEKLFKGYNQALKYYKSLYKKLSWYDAGFYWEDTDLIYGLVFVSLQNYINQCCIDFIDAGLFGFKDKSHFYSKNSIFVLNSDITQIRLIVDLANHYKHREDSSQNLNSEEKRRSHRFFKIGLIASEKMIYERFEDRVIVDGLELLIEDMDILKLLPIVSTWRSENWTDWNKLNKSNKCP